MAKKSEEHLALIRYVLQLTDLPRFVYEDSTEAQLQDEVVKELGKRNNYETLAWLACQELGLMSHWAQDDVRGLTALTGKLRSLKPTTWAALIKGANDEIQDRAGGVEVPAAAVEQGEETKGLV